MTALAPDAFVAWLREEGARRYHAHHPFHLRMHAGALDPPALRAWVLNRYYYQTRIPVKDALILSKSDDPAFRRWWIRRLHDHDDEDGGLALWLRLPLKSALICGHRSAPAIRACARACATRAAAACRS